MGQHHQVGRQAPNDPVNGIIVWNILAPIPGNTTDLPNHVAIGSGGFWSANASVASESFGDIARR